VISIIVITFLASSRIAAQLVALSEQSTRLQFERFAYAGNARSLRSAGEKSLRGFKGLAPLENPRLDSRRASLTGLNVTRGRRASVIDRAASKTA
jgi:hypothetical protein